MNRAIEHSPSRVHAGNLQQSQLAVTRDGLWGVIDTAQRRLFFDEPDLIKLSIEEQVGDEFPKFGMLKVMVYTASLAAAKPPSTPTSPTATAPDGQPQPISLPLTRGEVFRILGDDGANSTIDLNGKLMAATSKPDSPGSSWTFAIPSNRIAAFRVIDDIVPHDQVDQWRQG